MRMKCTRMCAYNKYILHVCVCVMRADRHRHHGTSQTAKQNAHDIQPEQTKKQQQQTPQNASTRAKLTSQIKQAKMQKNKLKNMERTQ